MIPIAHINGNFYPIIYHLQTQTINNEHKQNDDGCRHPCISQCSQYLKPRHLRRYCWMVWKWFCRFLGRRFCWSIRGSWSLVWDRLCRFLGGRFCRFLDKWHARVLHWNSSNWTRAHGTRCPSTCHSWIIWSCHRMVCEWLCWWFWRPWRLVLWRLCRLFWKWLRWFLGRRLRRLLENWFRWFLVERSPMLHARFLWWSRRIRNRLRTSFILKNSKLWHRNCCD